jgi:hypothetical protein
MLRVRQGDRNVPRRVLGECPYQRTARTAFAGRPPPLGSHEARRKSWKETMTRAACGRENEQPRAGHYPGFFNPNAARVSAAVATSSPITSMMRTAFSTSAALLGASWPRAR